MEIEQIKFTSKDALRDFINKHKINLHKLKNTWPNGFNSLELSKIPKMEKDLKYLASIIIKD